MQAISCFEDVQLVFSMLLHRPRCRECKIIGIGKVVNALKADVGTLFVSHRTWVLLPVEFSLKDAQFAFRHLVSPKDLRRSQDQGFFLTTEEKAHTLRLLTNEARRVNFDWAGAIMRAVDEGKILIGSSGEPWVK